MVWAVFVFLCAVAAIALALRSGWAWRLAVDTPNARSLHTRPTPRVGGVLVLPFVLLGGALASTSWVVSVLGFILWGISFVDDRAGLSVRIRFGMHFVVAGTFIALVAKQQLALHVLILLVVASVWMINLYNFMDGSDGLAGGMALMGFGFYAIAGWLAGDMSLAIFSGVVVAGALAFLVFNFPPARVFLGDAGSTTLGFLVAALGISGWLAGDWPVWFPAIVFSPFVVDATVTLLRRGLRKERVWQAHREHYYQRLIRMGWSHKRTALAEYAVMILAGVMSIALLHTDIVWQYVGVVLWLSFLALLMASIDSAWSRHLRGNVSCA